MNGKYGRAGAPAARDDFGKRPPGARRMGTAYERLTGPGRSRTSKDEPGTTEGLPEAARRTLGPSATGECSSSGGLLLLRRTQRAPSGGHCRSSRPSIWSSMIVVHMRRRQTGQHRGVQARSRMIRGLRVHAGGPAAYLPCAVQSRHPTLMLCWRLTMERSWPMARQCDEGAMRRARRAASPAGLK